MANTHPVAREPSARTVEEYCSMTKTALATTAIVRISRGAFDPARFEEVEQMSRLKEMIVGARKAAEAVGVTFVPIVNYPVSWVV
jgi:hypothetical protein